MGKTLLQTVPLFSAFNCCHLLSLGIKKKKKEKKLVHQDVSCFVLRRTGKCDKKQIFFFRFPKQPSTVSDSFCDYQLQSAVAYQRAHGALNTLLLFLCCEIYIQNIVLSLGKKGRGWGRSPERKYYFLYLQFARGFLFVWFGFSMN